MSRIIDLSVTVEDRMPAHKGLHKPFLIEHLSHQRSATMGFGTKEDPLTFAVAFFAMNDHIGTHVDAFYHVNPKGLTVDKMDISMFMGKAVCLDFRHIPDLGDIDVGDMEAAEKKSGVKIDGHIVLLCTGLHRQYYPTDEVSLQNPGVTAAATHWLADHNSKLHGVEGPSTDKPSNDLFPNHRVCRDRGITHYEWLCNLEELIGKGEFHFEGVPIRLGGATGSPVRAFARLG